MFARLKLWTNAAQVCGQLISSDFDTGALCFSRQLKFAKQMHWPIFISVKFRLFLGPAVLPLQHKLCALFTSYASFLVLLADSQPPAVIG